MLKKLRSLGIFLIWGLSVAACQTYRASTPLAPEVVSTPEPRVKNLVAFEPQAGNTDVIVILAILIFIFILVPILLHYKDWQSS